jgi:hypothetical protein
VFIGSNVLVYLQINELAAANKAYLGGDQDNKRETDNYVAAKFLAQRSFDVFGLSSEVRNLEVPVGLHSILLSNEV